MNDVGSPLWWLTKLSTQLHNRSVEMRRMDDYYTGNHPLPFLTKSHNAKISNEFRRMLDDSRSNFMRLVVDAVEERLTVEGFRLSASSNEAADRASWDIWQANQMDSESQTAFVEALVKGVAYVSVWAGDNGPTLAVEDPMQTIVGYVPGSNYRERAAAVKTWTDDWTGEKRANVYLPDGIWKFKAAAMVPQVDRGTQPAPAEIASWQEIPDSFVPNPLGIVPIVPVRNRPRLTCEGESEIADVFRIQNQINGFLFLLALAGYMGAHRQRWATGLAIMEDNQGKPVEPFNAAVDRLWTTDNPNVNFGEFSQTDLAGYINAIEQKILHIAVTTRTPRHYLIQQGQSPSGDAIKSAESGLTKKVERKQRPFGEGLEEAMRLARQFAGQPVGAEDSEIVWADPSIQTVGELTDATIKKFQTQLITRSQALEDLGYSPQQIARLIAVLGDGAAPDPTPADPSAVDTTAFL